MSTVVLPTIKKRPTSYSNHLIKIFFIVKAKFWTFINYKNNFHPYLIDKDDVPSH